MHNQAVLLYHLQVIDMDIARKRARLKEIEARLSGDETVAQATKQLADAEKALKPAQTRALDLELEIKSVAEKTKSADADLYSGRIANPKALQEIQNEIDSLKRHQSQLEDNLLETMVEVEDRQGQIAAAQVTLADARAALASTQTDLIAEQKVLFMEVAQADEKRKAEAAGIEAASLTAYDKLRQRFRGQAVGLLTSDGCSMCGVEQTSMTAQQVRLGRAIVYCESCGRILAFIS